MKDDDEKTDERRNPHGRKNLATNTRWGDDLVMSHFSRI